MFWCILPEICSPILWHENAIYRGFEKSFHAFKRGHDNVLHIRRGTSWNISNHSSQQYLLTTPLPNRISSIVYTQNKGRSEGVLSQQLCGLCSCFSIGCCRDNNYIYHMTKCNLLLFIYRCWNHNIDAGFVYYKSLNVTYTLGTNTWMCIYYIVVNKHILFYLAALTNKINTLFLH